MFCYVSGSGENGHLLVAPIYVSSLRDIVWI